MSISNLHEFTFQMLLLPTWLTMMCTVLYRLLYYGLIKGTACTYGFISLSILLSLGETVGKQGWNVFRSVEHLLPQWCWGEEELSDVDGTASGTDWLMLNSQQCLMHCLQHRKKHQKQLAFKNALNQHVTHKKKKGLTFIIMAKTLSRFKENVTCTNCSMSRKYDLT